MYQRLKSNDHASFGVPLRSGLLIGTILAACFYVCMFIGPVQSWAIYRVSTGHLASVVSVWIALVAMATWMQAWMRSHREHALANESREILDELVSSVPTDERDRTQWLVTMWKCQPTAIARSWFGSRVSTLIHKQLARGHSKYLPNDLDRILTNDLNQHAEAFRLTNVLFCIPIAFGMIGTLTSLTANQGTLSNASLDPIVVGLVASLLGFTLQAWMRGVEAKLIRQIHTDVGEPLQLYFVDLETKSEHGSLEVTIRNVTESFLTSVQQLVQKQSDVWRDTINDAHERWSSLTDESSIEVQRSLGLAIEQAMQAHHDGLARHAEQLAQIQNDGAILIDARWQQWQTTLSEQARATYQHQREIGTQTELLRDLIEKGEAIRSMDASLQSTLNRLTDIDLFHDAAICLTEAVAVLGIQLERNGLLGRQPARRRSVESNESAGQANEATPTIPMKRRAG